MRGTYLVQSPSCLTRTWSQITASAAVYMDAEHGSYWHHKSPLTKYGEHRAPPALGVQIRGTCQLGASMEVKDVIRGGTQLFL